ncbi:fatty alcohol:caffeoyl-CoA acyltransferase-like [Punica granatum]|uniref:Uncharacterized protein n=2 Tax=Punica granatum TaxID=22663 RepID=A0A218X7D3_PUNGR|nr:fatty alcohol:caffeoyl-CoA acyltransferase-like [Punica granatum]OWM80867.1 hypothetical protein CDL15_Pgr006898 [Punica granatum]PKI35166.1 hypothetical protein CRG98_044441 [Punica granatum]
MLTTSHLELPDCSYLSAPTLIKPLAPTPSHSLYLSKLDDQPFLRFAIKYLYLFRSPSRSSSVPSPGSLRSSLSKVLVDYYPLAGRLRPSLEDDGKLEVDCNGEGAVFVEGAMEITAEDFLRVSSKPNRSWRKLLHKVDARSFLDVPPLIVQVTKLRCGGMILCTGINHCLCDGIGTSQFLHAWAHITANRNIDRPPTPFHSRHVLSPRDPPEITSRHPVFTKHATGEHNYDLTLHLQSQPLVPVSVAIPPSFIQRLKRLCSPMLKCTAFEVLASHTWRSWARSLGLPPMLHSKLLFSTNFRKKLFPPLPDGFYGNGFLLACAECAVRDLVGSSDNLHHSVRLVQEAKLAVTEEYVRSVVDYLEADRSARPDLSASLVISEWSRLGLEEVDFGSGTAACMGPLGSDVYCLFLPVAGEAESVRVLLSLPESAAEKFEYYMRGGGLSNEGENGNCANYGFHEEDVDGMLTCDYANGQQCVN